MIMFVYGFINMMAKIQFDFFHIFGYPKRACMPLLPDNNCHLSWMEWMVLCFKPVFTQNLHQNSLGACLLKPMNSPSQYFHVQFEPFNFHAIFKSIENLLAHWVRVGVTFGTGVHNINPSIKIIFHLSIMLIYELI